MSKKRTIDSFFARDPKKQKVTTASEDDDEPSYSTHHTYPFAIRNLSESTTKEIASLPARPGRELNNQPDLDLLYFEPYVPPPLAKQLFHFLRSQLPFYRVEYTIKRGGIETNIRTPRFTTVFGIDETSLFNPDDNGATILDAKTRQPLPNTNIYERYAPRLIPQCLDQLRKSTESATGHKFNFCLVNYYASGSDSISFHSDDERFLGPDPAIASFSLGAARDFLMKHKPIPQMPPPSDSTGAPVSPAPQQLKLSLSSGDMVLMRGKTQANWLHSIPKRTGKKTENDGGRINITFRRAMVKGGTDNYYNYNVGKGPVFRWDEVAKEMKEWKSSQPTITPRKLV
ncbi:putative alpha-ketoglutarate-dependent dioxygenase [Cladorrhinum sp. PSN259]|nr:putative alpha-ketoglutarate-dependent dioxygenase [Cladorrhinum sp. PSN259]